MAEPTGGAKGEKEAVRRLFNDWLGLACGDVAEYSGSIVDDWRNLRDQAIERAATLGIEWVEADYLPLYVAEALAYDETENGSEGPSDA